VTVALFLGYSCHSAVAQTWQNEHVRSLILAGNTTNYGNTLTLAAPSLSTSPTITLPGASLTFPTTNATGVLLNNGSGTLSWLDITGVLINPMTSPGDMIYGGLLGIPTRLAATSTAHQILLSGANAAPSWSTATYPATSGSAGNYLRSDGTNFVSTTIQAADVPTLNQSTTGTASNVTGVVALANGGTGVTNASGIAQNAVFVGPASGGAGAASWRVLQTADIPSLSGTYLPLGGGTMTGDILIGAHNVTGTSGAFTGGSLVLTGTSHNGTITVPASLGQATAYSIPDPGAASATIALTTSNITGTAANVTGVVALANGGTGVTNASGIAQNAVFVGPASGGAGAASWRVLQTADIPSLSATYLPLAGGTMSGAIAMGGNNITGGGTISGTTLTGSSLVLTGTSHNGTITVPSTLGQATAYSIPDPGAASATIALTTSNITGTAANVTGVVALANGGTNANLTASNGGIFYSTASAGAILVGTSTANQVLLSGASAAPTWSTATYPATAGTAGNVLQSDGTNWVSTAGGWTTVKVSSDFTRTSNTLATITGLSFTATASTTYEIEGWLDIVEASTGGCKLAVNSSGTSPTVLITYEGQLTSDAAGSILTTNANATATSAAFVTTSGAEGFVHIIGIVKSGTGSPTISIEAQAGTNGNQLTVKAGSKLMYRVQ